MKEKLIFSSVILSALLLFSCDNIANALQSQMDAATPFSGSSADGISTFFGDVKDSFSGTLAPRKLDGLQLTLSGALDERKDGTIVTYTVPRGGSYLKSPKIDGLNSKNKCTYQIVDIFTFRGCQSFRRGGDINRLNKPKIKITGNDYYSRKLAEREAINNAIGSMNFSAYDCGHSYERTSDNTATLANSSEQYVLTFTDKTSGTYTYTHTIDDALIGQGKGTFKIGEEESPFEVIKNY